MRDEGWECECGVELLNGYTIKLTDFKSIKGQGQKGIRSIVSTIGRHLLKSVKLNKNGHSLFNSTENLLFCVFTTYKVLLQVVYTKMNIVLVFFSSGNYQSFKIDSF